MHARGSAPVDDGAIAVGTSALFVVVGAVVGWFAVPVDDALVSVDGLALFATASPLFNGLVTVLLATAATLVSLFLPGRDGANVATAVSGLAIELIAVAFVLAPNVALGPTVTVSGDVPLASVGVGVYLTLVGGLGILLGGVWSYRRR